MKASAKRRRSKQQILEDRLQEEREKQEVKEKLERLEKLQAEFHNMEK